MSKEISTQQICTMMGMKASQLCLFVHKESNNFPACTRIGGITGKTRFYDYNEVVEWMEAWKCRKLTKTSADVLIKQFLAGKFDRSELKKKYINSAIASRKTKPKTQKIHVNENFDNVQWGGYHWRGLI